DRWQTAKANDAVSVGQLRQEHPFRNWNAERLRKFHCFQLVESDLEGQVRKQIYRRQSLQFPSMEHVGNDSLVGSRKHQIEFFALEQLNERLLPVIAAGAVRRN